MIAVRHAYFETLGHAHTVRAAQHVLGQEPVQIGVARLGDDSTHRAFVGVGDRSVAYGQSMYQRWAQELVAFRLVRIPDPCRVTQRLGLPRSFQELAKPTPVVAG